MSSLTGGMRRCVNRVNGRICGASVSTAQEKARRGTMWLSSKKKTGKTYFGDRLVDEDEKIKLVNKVFSSVYKNYDLMNDVMSLGMHNLWKKCFVSRMAPRKNTSLLDVAGGTGDVTFEFLRHSKCLYGDDSNVSAKLVDINPNMLQVAIERADEYEAELNADLSIEHGDAENLSNVYSESVDIYSIAFGLRNCTKIDKVLSEAYRVLKPGGKFLCLEFATVNTPVVSCLYDFYSFSVIPFMGELIAKDRGSYKYLAESIRKFPDRRMLADMIRGAGFVTIGNGWEDLSMGIVSIHTGHKI